MSNLLKRYREYMRTADLRGDLLWMHHDHPQKIPKNCPKCHSGIIRSIKIKSVNYWSCFVCHHYWKINGVDVE